MVSVLASPSSKPAVVLKGPLRSGERKFQFIFALRLLCLVLSVIFFIRLFLLMDSMASNPKNGETLPSEWDFSCDLEIDFKSEKNASMVHAALAVDKELQPDKVKRQMSVFDGKLSVHFEAVEARFLRASFSAFVDILILATKTIEEFGPAMEL